MRYVVERFWPGATEAVARSAMEGLRSSCRKLAATGIPISYLGGTFVLADEAMACRFEGTAQAVRAAHDLVGLEFDRLLETVEVEADVATFGIDPVQTAAITDR